MSPTRIEIETTHTDGRKESTIETNPEGIENGRPIMGTDAARITGMSKNEMLSYLDRKGIDLPRIPSTYGPPFAKTRLFSGRVRIWGFSDSILIRLARHKEIIHTENLEDGLVTTRRSHRNANGSMTITEATLRL